MRDGPGAPRGAGVSARLRRAGLTPSSSPGFGGGTAGGPLPRPSLAKGQHMPRTGYQRGPQTQGGCVELET